MSTSSSPTTSVFFEAGTLEGSALQQPTYDDTWLLRKVGYRLRSMPPIVTPTSITALGERLSEVAQGRAQVLQAGDCAERPTDCVAAVLSRKVDQLDALAATLELRSGLPSLRVGRIAGQFAKPRSASVEVQGEHTLPVFRGLIVNGPAPRHGMRRHDPIRLLHAYSWSSRGTAWLEASTRTAAHRVWTSHEALVLDYERHMVRPAADGRPFLTSTHWPWVGNRTRDPDGAHIRLLARIANPVAVKVGPDLTPAALLRLCGLLDPDRTPGRLTLISRMGAQAVRDALPTLVVAVRRAGHPVIWMCDPMHGNTFATTCGLKTRAVTDVAHEVDGFSEVMAEADVHRGGLHLEATPFAVHECVEDRAGAEALTTDSYSTLCDPRLNPMQSLAVAARWAQPGRHS